MFGKLKNLFRGAEKTTGDSGLYVYVRLEKTGEIVRLRLAPEHELNWDDDEQSYVSHKTVIGPRTFARADAWFRFDDSKKLVGSEIDGGEIVTEAAWRQQAESKSTE